MTNLTQSDAQDERNQEDALDGLKIADLRRVAKILGISAQRDWATEDFVNAIKAKQEQAATPSLVFDGALAPKPGYARILVHRDMSPGHKNTPIHAAFNGWIFAIPRGIEVDVPKEIIEVLSNAKALVTRQEYDDQGRTSVVREDLVQSYPFQVLAISPGQARNPHDNRGATAIKRQEFCDKFGRYPTGGEFAEYLKTQMAKTA